MGQVNVNPGGSSGDSGAAAAAGVSAGMMMVIALAVIVLLLLAFFWLRPLVFGGGTDVNVNVRSSDLIDVFAAYL